MTRFGTLFRGVRTPNVMSLFLSAVLFIWLLSVSIHEPSPTPFCLTSLFRFDSFTVNSSLNLLSIHFQTPVLQSLSSLLLKSPGQHISPNYTISLSFFLMTPEHRFRVPFSHSLTTLLLFLRPIPIYPGHLGTVPKNRIILLFGDVSRFVFSSN